MIKLSTGPPIANTKEKVTSKTHCFKEDAIFHPIFSHPPLKRFPKETKASSISSNTEKPTTEEAKAIAKC